LRDVQTNPENFPLEAVKVFENIVWGVGRPNSSCVFKARTNHCFIKTKKQVQTGEFESVDKVDEE
jgi:hypothetical protein